MKRFWMVHVCDKNPSKETHSNFDSAEGEAIRLAKLFPGSIVHVLETVQAYGVQDPPIVKISYDRV